MVGIVRDGVLVGSGLPGLGSAMPAPSGVSLGIDGVDSGLKGLDDLGPRQIYTPGSSSPRVSELP